MGLLELLDEIMRARGPRPQNAPENASSLIPPGGTGGLLGRLATMTAPVPGVGDAMGLLSDAHKYATEPESRTPGNFGLSAMGLLPFVPSMAGTFAGVGAKTADVAALGKAQAMAKSGADPVEVWKATGWTDQFPDKKWRFEINDQPAKVSTSALNDIRRAENYMGKEFYSNAELNAMRQMRDIWPVKEGMYHPTLMRNYPEIGEYPMEIDNSLSGYGAFSDLDKAIGFKPGTDKQMNSTLLHELQHAIQQREGFASGGRPGMDLGMMLPQGWRSPEAEAALLAKQIKQWEGKYTKALDTTIQDAAPEIVPIARHWAKTKTLDELKQLAGNADYEGYRRLAGEAEARLTQSRIPLTAAERRARPPWLEFDVPREQQIVRGLLNP